MKPINIATVFSGIGAPEQTLLKMGIKSNVIFACDNGEISLNMRKEEIEKNIKSFDYVKKNEYIKSIYKKTKKINYVKQSYFANYKIDEKNWYDDIRFLDGKPYRNKVDLFVGGSPCQSFSIIGKRAGLEDARGTLFYDYARLIKEIKPKVFVYENVPGMLVHHQGETWTIIQKIFNRLSYEIFFNVLNSMDYGIPQNRKRLFVIGFKKRIKFQFPEKIELRTTVDDYLENFIDKNYYLGKKGFEFVTNPKYKNRARINSQIIQTEKANQQYNWNGDFIFEDINKVKLRKNYNEIIKRAYISNYNGTIGVVRQMTHRECLRLMGFSDDFKIVVPNVQAYRQAGNSIVVNVLEALFSKIFEVVNFND